MQASHVAAALVAPAAVGTGMAAALLLAMWRRNRRKENDRRLRLPPARTPEPSPSTATASMTPHAATCRPPCTPMQRKVVHMNAGMSTVLAGGMLATECHSSRIGSHDGKPCSRQPSRLQRTSMGCLEADSSWRHSFSHLTDRPTVTADSRRHCLAMQAAQRQAWALSCRLKAVAAVQWRTQQPSLPCLR